MIFIVCLVQWVTTENKIYILICQQNVSDNRRLYTDYVCSVYIFKILDKILS